MDMDLSKYVADVQLTEAEKSVLTFLLTHLDEALKLGVRGIARRILHLHPRLCGWPKNWGTTVLLRCTIRLLGKAKEEKPNYEVNEGFASQFLQENWLSLAMYPRIRLAAQQICETKPIGLHLWYGFFCPDGGISGQKVAGTGNQVHLFGWCGFHRYF